MSALPNSGANSSPNNQDPITRFRHKYQDALNDALVQAEHTNTEGWKALYSTFTKKRRDDRRSVAAQLRDIADTIENVGHNEDHEKLIGEQKKMLVEMRLSDEHFEASVIQPIRQTVDKCSLLLSDFIRSAQNAEETQPLVNVGLVELAKAEIEKTRKVSWNDETGIVSIPLLD